MPMAGFEALRETQGPSSNQVSNRPEHPPSMGLPQATEPLMDSMPQSKDSAFDRLN